MELEDDYMKSEGNSWNQRIIHGIELFGYFTLSRKSKCLKNPNNYYFNRNQPNSWVLLLTKKNIVIVLTPLLVICTQIHH